MKRNILYKILAGLIFITLLVFLILFFQKIKNLNLPQSSIVFLIGSAFSGFFLFILVTWVASQKEKVIKIVKKPDEKNEQDIDFKEEDLEEVVKAKEQVEKAANNLLTKIDTVKSVENFSETLLKNLAKEFSIVQGIVFLYEPSIKKFKVSATYAFYSNEEVREFGLGEGISGQVAKNMEILNISNIPENYITILSGLGSSSPKHLLIFPLINEFDTIGIVEIASFSKFPDNIKKIYENIAEPLGQKAAEFLPDMERSEIF